MNLDDLPDEIVQPLLELGSSLLTHARAHRDHSLADHEEGVLGAWRTAAPALLEAVLQLATTGLEKNARPITGVVHAVSNGAECSPNASAGSTPAWVRLG